VIDFSEADIRLVQTEGRIQNKADFEEFLCAQDVQGEA
jgi:hypothetical protein